MNHYSPASVGGADSAALARRVSAAYSAAYHRSVSRANSEAETLRLLPPGQPQDDLWSGSPADERFWRANADLVISRKASGLTRAQRGIAPAGPDYRPDAHPDAHPDAAHFLQSTKKRSAHGR